MAHELELREDGTARMFYSGDTPWHALGTPVDGVLTAAEALSAGGLDWSVEKQPVYLGDGTAVPDRFAIVRTEDSRPLGVVGTDYKPIQNSDAFDFFDTLVDSGDAKYETAGSLFGGRRVWLTAQLKGLTVAGEDHRMYLLFSNSHDGSRAFTAATTMVRAVCSNTVTMALSDAKTKWTMTHRSTLTGKAHEAREALQLAFRARDAFSAEVERLLRVPVTDDAFRAIVTDLLPKQKRQLDKNVDALTSIWSEEPTVVDTDAKGTGWGAYNAATFWTDHVREVRSQDARMTSLMDGFAKKFRNDVRERVLALA